MQSPSQKERRAPILGRSTQLAGHQIVMQQFDRNGSPILSIRPTNAYDPYESPTEQKPYCRAPTKNLESEEAQRMKQIYENATIDPFEIPSPISESNKKPCKVKTFCDGFGSAEKIGKGIDFYSKELDLDDFTR